MVNRRDVFVGAAGFAAASALLANARGAGLPKRSEATSPDGKAQLASYRRGVQVMKQRSQTSFIDPTGWSYQALIHGILTLDTKSAFIDRVFRAVPLTDPRRVLAQATWATCPHGMIEFLPWHRLYVHFFERIVRDASGDPNFVLPYWDYSRTAATLPEEFREAVDGTPLGNSLFDNARDAGINGLFGTGPTSLRSQDVALDALKEPTFAESTTRNGFSAELENVPHGNVHVALGGDGFFTAFGDMSRPPTAGRDPIFWLHHCNIDRLWESWLVKGGETAASYASASWYTQRWTFIDETGQRRDVSLQDLDGELSGHSYAQLVDNIPRDALVELASASTPLSQAPVELGERTVIPLGAAVQALPEAGSRTVRIELDDVSPPTSPTAVFDVFFVNGQGKEIQVGTFNFFGSIHEGMVMTRRFVFRIPTETGTIAGGSVEIRSRGPLIGSPPVAGSVSLTLE